MDGAALARAELGALAADGIVVLEGPRRAAARPCSPPAAASPGPAPQPSPRSSTSRPRAPIQERAVPEATPRWFVPGRGEPPFGPPWFVKPAVGRLSMGAHLVDDAAALPAGRRGTTTYAQGWESLARLGGVALDGHGWIAEDVLTGTPVTVEGYVHARAGSRSSASRIR